MRRRKCVVLVVSAQLVLSIARGIGAQQQVQAVIGTVRDTAGIALGGAAVTLGERRAATDSLGNFRFDGLAPGRYSLTIRLLGYEPIRSQVPVIATQATELEFFLVPRPIVLPITVVTGNRTGIFGVVGDTAFRKAVGVRVQVLGPGGGEARTDTSGRFAFPEIDRGLYMVRVTHPGYTERRLLVELKSGEGREFAVLLTPADRLGSLQDEIALQDLGRRLSWGRERERISGTELASLGSASLCTLAARITGEVGSETTLILNGRTVIAPWPVSSVCSWQADEVDLVEFGRDYCADVTQTVVGRLGGWCSGRMRAVPRNINPGGTRPSSVVRSYVIIWEKK